MSLEDSTIALAGIFQAANLVQQIAYHGIIDQTPFDKPFANSMQSLLKIDAASTAEVYSGIAGVELGLQTLCAQFEANTNRQKNAEIMRYVLGLMFLERKLIKQATMLQKIRTGIEQVISQTNTYPITHPANVELLARIYVDTLSTFEFRIQVKGEQGHLKKTQCANQARALLLAGIRSAVLWRQKGGSRWKLLFSRKKIVLTAHQLLEQIQKVMPENTE